MKSRQVTRSSTTRRTAVSRRRQKLVALHHQVYLTLRNELIRGHYGGQGGGSPAPLPAENELASQFKVSRVTVRRALAVLEQEGLIVRRHGAGTFPVASASHLRRTRDVETLYEDVTDLLQGYQLDVLAFERMTTPGFVLDHAPDFGTECVHLSVLSRHEGAPVHLNYQYMPSRYAVLLDPRREANTSLLVTLQRNGLRSATVDLNISSAAADLATATRLDVQVGVPLLATRRISRDAQGGVLEYFEALTRPDRYSYSFRFEPGAR